MDEVTNLLTILNDELMKDMAIMNDGTVDIQPI